MIPLKDHTWQAVLMFACIVGRVESVHMFKPHLQTLYVMMLLMNCCMTLPCQAMKLMPLCQDSSNGTHWPMGWSPSAKFSEMQTGAIAVYPFVKMLRCTFSIMIRLPVFELQWAKLTRISVDAGRLLGTEVHGPTASMFCTLYSNRNPCRIECRTEKTSQFSLNAIGCMIKKMVYPQQFGIASSTPRPLSEESGELKHGSWMKDM